MLAIFVIDLGCHHETPARLKAFEEEMKILAEIEPFSMGDAVRLQKIGPEHALDRAERKRLLPKAQLARKKDAVSTVKA